MTKKSREAIQDFEIRKLVNETIDYIGMCLRVPLSKEAKKNIRTWLRAELKIAWIKGDRQGSEEAHDFFINEVLKKEKKDE